MFATRVARARRSRRRGRGQALVEFALVLPIFVTLLLGIIEFGFLFNALLSINFATRDASLLAAEAGNGLGADCVIIQKIEQSVTAPARTSQITQVSIYKSDKVGGPIGGYTNLYVRDPASPMTCNMADGTTLTVPYRLSGSLGYQDTTRCNVLAGCSGSGGVDTIGVKVSYQYQAVTPFGVNPLLTKSNAMRMEPVL